MNLTSGQLARTTQEIKRSLAGLPLPLGPGAGTGWPRTGRVVASGAAASAVLNGAQPTLEMLYRNSVTSNASLVAGSYAAGPEPPGPWRWRSPRRPRRGSGCTQGAE